MQRETVTFDTEAEWLAQRHHDVTSTEAAALFGASPYLTEYELFHRKTGQLVADFDDNSRIVWGRRLEDAIALGIAEDCGLKVEPYKVYRRITELRMGSSFDYRIVGLMDDWHGDEYYRDLFRHHGPGILECKNVDFVAYRKGWIEDDEEFEAPPHIELQVQHQMETDDVKWSMIGALVAGNTPKVMVRMRDEKVCHAITTKVAAFWQRVDEGKAPSPDYSRDGDAIKALNIDDNAESVDMSDNTHLGELCAEYKDAAKDEKAAVARKKTAQAEIMDMIGPAAKVNAGGYKISAKTRKANPGQLVTPDMIGQYIGGRKATRYPTITEVKK